MKKTISSIALVALLSVPTFSFASSKSLMTIVTSPNPQTQLMSMVLSIKSMMKGAKVDILLCGPAGDIATKGSKEVILKPKDMSAQMLLKKMIKKGVSVKVCPLYLPNIGKTKADLIKGVSVANPGKIADMLLEDNRVVLTY
jgi:predicted peroxiredoxin